MSKDREATPTEIQKIIDCIKLGRVTCAGNIDLLNQPDGPITINSVTGWEPWRSKIDGKPVGNDGGFEVYWSKPGKGFGVATFILQNGKWTCDDEFMGRDFINEIIKMLRLGDYGDVIAKKYIPDMLRIVDILELRSDAEEF